MAQSVKCPTSAQVIISTVCEFEPCVSLCADSSEPGACFGFCVFLSLPLPHLCSVSLSQKEINMNFFLSKFNLFLENEWISN